jgi:hypothetical protein
MILDGAGTDFWGNLPLIYTERAMRSRLVLHVSLLLAACALAGCGALTNVSATSNVTSQYSHVWVTIQDVKFNTSATAAAGDSSWLDFPLTTPVTIDLATVTNGGLAVFGTSLKIPTGNYAQMQLLLTDTTAPLTTSAQTAGLIFNDQVGYLDATGAALTAPLDLVHPENGIVLSVSLSIPSNLKAELEALNEGGSETADEEDENGTTTSTGLATTTTPTTTGELGVPTSTCATTTTDTATTTPITTTTNNCTNGVATATFTVGIDFDAEKDLVPFTYSGQPGFLLNPHLVAYDLSTAGTIQGTITLPTVSATTTASGNPAIEVSAETLSSDGTRHVVVKSAPVLTDGSFVLYPLATNASTTNTTTTTTYDLVIHGPNIQTTIIQSVAPSVAAPAAATSVTLTISPASAPDYLVNVSTATGFSSAGALVQFYQTIPVSGEVPYVVAQQPIDPFNNDFAGDAALAMGTIAVSVYSGGVNTTPVSEAPSEGENTYQVAAIAPNFNNGTLGTKVTAPAEVTATTPAVVVTLAPLNVATGGTSATLEVATAVAAPGKYTNGDLILSQNGAIVAVAPIGVALDQSSGSVTFSHVPGGTSSATLGTGVYDLSAWVWNSSNPSGTLTRVASPTSINLSSGSSSGATITID